MSDDHKAIKPADVEIVEHHNDVSAMAMAMLERDMTPETAEKVLDFIERMDRISAERAFTSALVEMKRALPSVIKHDRRVAFKNVRYSHLSLARFVEIVEPILSDYGFALTFEAATPVQGLVSVTATLTHKAGHSKSITLDGPPDTGSGRNSIQAIASTTTYLRRYTASMLLGIATADMPDLDESETDVDPDAVDLQRNMRAATKLDSAGLLHRAEEEVEKPSRDWTAADLEHLWRWAKEQKDH